jgi:hypothetical protein
MPQYIDFAEFSNTLKKPRFNKNEAKKCIAKYRYNYVVEGINFPDTFQLKCNKKQTIIRLLDKSDIESPRIAYAVDIEITKEKINQQSCTQVLVWRRSGDQVVRGFAAEMFKHFLQKYIVMITDEQQTAAGKKFWEDQIVYALKDGYCVYFYDRKGINGLQRIKTEEDFFETFEPLGWGNDLLHQNKWFLISLLELNSLFA